MKYEYTKNYKILLAETLVNRLSTKLLKQFNGERPIFVINGARKTGYPYGKKML